MGTSPLHHCQPHATASRHASGMGRPSPALVSAVLQVRCSVTQLLPPATDASQLSYPQEQPHVPGNTSPAPRAVNSPPGNAVSVLSLSFPHFPAQGLVLSVGTGKSGCNPARAHVPDSPGKLLNAVGVPTVLSGETAAGPIFGIGIKMVSPVPPPRFALHSPSKAGPRELSGLVTRLTLHSPRPHSPALVSQPKHCR